jgi:hypothetical protein
MVVNDLAAKPKFRSAAVVHGEGCWEFLLVDQFGALRVPITEIFAAVLFVGGDGFVRGQIAPWLTHFIRSVPAFSGSFIARARMNRKSETPTDLVRVSLL